MNSFSFLLRSIIFIVFGVAILLLLTPFIASIAWGLIMAISLWPLYNKYECYFKSGKLSMLLSIILFIILVLPLLLVGINLVSIIPEAYNHLVLLKIPNMPMWIVNSPFWTNEMNSFWQKIQNDTSNLKTVILPTLHSMWPHVLSISKSFMIGSIQMGVSIIFNALILQNAQKIWDIAHKITSTLFPEIELDILEISCRVIKSITIGVIGTAILQMLVMLVLLFLCDTNLTLILAVITFLFAVAQIPTFIIWLPLAIFQFTQDNMMLSVLCVLIGAIGLGFIDNFMKPAIISKESDMPMFIIFIGVIGGLLSWGLLGLFLGPILLTVLYTLLSNWLDKTK